MRHLDIGAVAATGAFFLVAFDAAAVPTLPVATGAWLDAVANEWIVWFTAFYVLLVGGVALKERAASLLRGRVADPA